MMVTRAASVDNSSGFWQDSGKNAQVALRNGSGSLTMLIQSSGNIWLNGGSVGIGTSSPSTNLEITGTVAPNPAPGMQDLLSLHRPYNAGLAWDNWAVFSLGRYFAGDSYPNTRFDLKLTGGTTTSGSESNASTVMTWLGNGNVGIGTTVPTATLDVSGTIKSNGNPVVTTTIAGGLKIVSGKTPFSGCTSSSWLTVSVTYTSFSAAPTCTATPFSNQTNGGAIQYHQGNTTGSVMEPTVSGFYYSMVCDTNPNKFSGNLHWICVGQ